MPGALSETHVAPLTKAQSSTRHQATKESKLSIMAAWGYPFNRSRHYMLGVTRGLFGHSPPYWEPLFYLGIIVTLDANGDPVSRDFVVLGGFEVAISFDVADEPVWPPVSYLVIV